MNISTTSQTPVSPIQPACRHFERCGGCTLQHLAEDDYAAHKLGQVRQALAEKQLTPAIWSGPFISPPGTRRRATMAAYRDSKDVLVLGFNEARSNKIVDLAECPVMVPRLVDLVPLLREALPGILQDKQGMDIAMTESLGQVDIVLRPWVKAKNRTDHLPRHIVERLAVFAEKGNIARITWQNNAADPTDLSPVLWRAPFTVDLSGVTVTPPPGGFLQATAPGEDALTRAVLAGLSYPKKKPKKVMDLYAGCGTFTFAMAAEKYKVHAVEGYAPALSALQDAAQGYAVTCERRDLADDPLMHREFKGYDAVVLDPPRVGAMQQVKNIVRSDVGLVISVSCSLSSFVRDALVLTQAGFRFETLTVVDQFLWSPHIELVGVFCRR